MGFFRLGGTRSRGRPVNTTPPWALALASSAWSPQANTDFFTQASAILPSASYLGSDPIRAIIDTFDDPTPSYDGKGADCFGGGHTDGSVNSQIHFDFYTLGYSLNAAPTPPSKYPPSYTAPNSAIVYPSGLAPGYFSSTLTDPRDTPYNAPQDAPQSQHMYAGSVQRKNGVISYFYGKYTEFDTVNKVWEYLANQVDLGAQLNAINSEFGTSPLGEGTAAVYDDVTDQTLVSMTPGSAGASWRAGFFLFDHPTRQIVPSSVHQNGNLSYNGSISLTKIGRYAYGFCPSATSGVVDCLNGWRYNFDTQALEYIRVQGDTFSFTVGSSAEVVPAGAHLGRGTIIRWNYQTEPGNLYEVNLTPVSGGGTLGSPYMLQQTRITPSGTPPSGTQFNYRRVWYYAAGNCLVFMPSASSNIYAVKL